jgi:GT2 family glycosyltransferase
MSHIVDVKACVIVPNWNGAEHLSKCLDSLQKQSLDPHIIVVDNGSVDDSVELIETRYPNVELIKHSFNKGYAGGVNPGFKRAIEIGARYAAAFNNDAIADRDWLKNLVAALDDRPEVGAAACKLLSADGRSLDSSGDYYTNWGLPYPRGRGETDIDRYDSQTEIFGASGGASLYRVEALEKVGLFDEDFFAYYEDVDLSFRLQLQGWKVVYVPAAKAYHQLSATSFNAHQTMKNLQLLVYKNVPRKYLFSVSWRFMLAHTAFLFRAITRGQGWAALRGDLKGKGLLVKKRTERRQIQKSKKVSDEYIWSIIVHDLPPNARALRRLRSAWWRLRRKSA